MRHVSKVLLCTLFSFIIIQKIQAQFTAINNGNWNTPATWQGGVVPPAGADVIIAANVSIDVANVTVGNLTINTGFTLTGVYTNSITMNSGKTFTNNGTLSGTLGSTLYTFIFAGSGLVAGSSLTNFATVQINGAVDFGTTSSVQNLTINAGGSVNTNRPTYTIGSSLNYNTGGTYIIGDEWVTGNTNYPRALTINAGTTLSFGNITTSRRVGGVNDAMNINGGMILSSAAGGDLIITSTYNNFNGTFNANGRTVTCLDGGSNCIVGGSQPVVFDNLVLNLPGKQFNLSTQVTVTTSATFTAGYTQLNNSDLIFNSGATITGASANCYVYTTGAGKLVMKGVGAGPLVAPIGRNIGNNFIHYNPITITNGGGFDYAIKANATAPTGAGILNATKVIRCQWDITPSGNPTNVDLKFQYITGQGVSGGTFSETAPQRGLRYNTGTSAWETIGTATPVGTNPYNVSYTFSGPTWGLFSFESVTPPPQPPTITSFSPTTGPVGTTVTITGTNFNTTVANNIVFFGATKATVTAASATSLTVSVPLGATYESISVINSSTGLQVASGGKFSPTISTPKSILPATDFEPIKDLGSNGQQAIATQLADIDGDGKLDVINGLQNGNMSVRRNTSIVGNISLASPVFLNGTSNGFIIAKVADMDGDGKLDIIGVSNADNFIRVYLNNSTPGTISFSSQKTFFIATTSGALNNLEVADFDNDGKPDMVIVDGWGTSASMFRNTSTGTGTANLTFASPVSVPGLATGENINSTYAGDVDGDGKMDLVISYCTVSAPTIIAVLKNQSAAGTFSFASPVNLVHGTSSVQCGRLLKFADINGDGKLDILSINNQDNSLHYFINTTTASISFAAYQSIATIDNAQSFDMGDVNGDGKIDMVIQNATNYSGIQGNDQMLMANSTTAGNVSFVRSDIQQNLNATTGSPNGYWRINLGDLDGDGKMDLYIASSNYPTSKSFAIRYNQQFQTVTTSGTLTAFAGCSGSASTSQSFTVSGSALSANLVVTAPTGYEVSTTTGSGYASSVTLTPASGTVANTTIFVRLAATATGTPAGNITVASTGATTQNVAVTGTVNALPAATITAGGPTTFCQGGSVTLSAPASTSTGGNAINISGGAGNYVSVPHSSSINLGAGTTYTIESWIRVTDATNNTIVDKGDYNFLFQTHPNGNQGLGLYNRSFGWIYSAGTIPTNQWVHVAVTYNNRAVTFYKDGVVQGTYTASTNSTGDNGSLNIGRQQPGSCNCNIFDGSMDELRLWNVVKTQAEIQASMNTTVPSNSTGLVAYYKFDESTGNSVADATANANNGTVVNTASWLVPSTSPVGGTSGPTVNYVWSLGGATTSSINATASGSYTLTANSSNGCSATSTATVVTVNSLVTTNTITAAQTICTGSTPAQLNGSTPTGGTGTYTYLWQRSTTSATAGFSAALNTNTNSNYQPTSLTQTTWFRRVVTSGICDGDTSAAIMITVNSLVTTNTITASQTICTASTPAQLTGSTPTGGDGTAYAYLWQRSTTSAIAGFSPALNTNTTINYQPTSLTQTTWFRRVVTSGFCNGDTSMAVMITVNSLVTTNTITASQTICSGSTPAQLNGFTPAGGTGTYSYLWQRSTTSATAGFSAALNTNTTINYQPTSLTQTTWFRRVVTSGVCNGDTSAAVMITVTVSVTTNTITAAQTICTASTPAQLTGSTPAGGTGTFTYLWQRSTTSATAGFTAALNVNTTINYQPTSLTQTTWFRRVVTSGACNGDTSTAVMITVNALVTTNTITAAQSICTGSTPASLTGSTPTGGTGTYAYLWQRSTTSATAGFTAALNVNTTINYQPTSLTQTTWFRRVVTSGVCNGDTSAVVMITVNSLPVASISSASTVLCGPTATLNLTAIGGTTYQWSIGGIPIVGATAATYTANAIGTYTATATSAQGCTAPATGSIVLTRLIAAVPAFNFDSYCINTPINFTNQTVTTGAGTVSYTWSDNVGNSATSTNTSITYANTGSYNVKLRVQSTVCTNLADSITRTVVVENPLAATRYAPVDAAMNDNTPLQARNFGTNYTWIPSTGLNNAFTRTPIANITAQQQYRIAIRVPSGCVTVDTVLVRVHENYTVYVPNVFTPNGDGRNDKVIILPVGITQLRSFRIYNRWNKKVFETSDINGGWDGKVNGVLQPMDTYVWKVEAIGKDGNLIAKTGSITLLR